MATELNTPRGLPASEPAFVACRLTKVYRMDEVEVHALRGSIST